MDFSSAERSNTLLKEKLLSRERLSLVSPVFVAITKFIHFPLRPFFVASNLLGRSRRIIPDKQR